MADAVVSTKTCTLCHAYLPLASFYLNSKGRPAGGQCKACRSAKVQEALARRKADPAEMARIKAWRLEHKRKVRATKGCTPRAEIAAAAEARRKAKEAEREAKRIARTAQQDAHVKRWRGMIRSRDYQREKLKCPAYRAQEAARKRARLASDPIARARHAAYMRQYLQRPEMRVHHRLSKQIRESLSGAKNRRSWQSLVGYTREDLMRHLERQFLPGMSWANMDQWHIDHIRPRASFTFNSANCPDFKACWSLTNLRPLWAEDNMKKGARLLYLC